MKKTDRDIAFLLGLPFNVMTMDEVIEDAVKMVQAKVPRYMVTANSDFIAQAYRNERLSDILFHADRTVCDGMPLVWVSRIFKPELPERVAGSDMVFRLFTEADKYGWKVYFLGSDKTTLAAVSEILGKRYPKMEVVGCFSPPFAAVEDWPNEEIVSDIAAKKPDLLLVAVGCPKQEYWISEYHKEIQVPLSVGIGASLDFINGTQVRAPIFMQKCGLEWLWRMLGSPRRLYKRYAKDLYYLVVLSVLQWRLTRLRKRGKLVAPLPGKGMMVEDESGKGSSGYRLIFWRGNVEHSNLEEAELPVDYDKPVFLNLEQVEFMDSSGIGRLAKIAKESRQHGVAFGLINPATSVIKIIEAMHLTAQFPVYRDEAELLEKNKELARSWERGNARRIVLSPPFNRKEILDSEGQIGKVLLELKEGDDLLIDLGQLEFVDSYAISLLLRVLRRVRELGGELRVENVNPQPKQAMELMRVYEILINGGRR